MVAWIRITPPGVRLSRAPRYDRFTRILPRFVYNAPLLFIFYSRCGGRLLFFFVSSLRAQVRDPRCMPCLSCFCRHGELSSTLYADLVTSRTGAHSARTLPAGTPRESHIGRVMVHVYRGRHSKITPQEVANTHVTSVRCIYYSISIFCEPQPQVAMNNMFFSNSSYYISFFG